MLAGVLIRQFFVLRHKGSASCGCRWRPARSSPAWRWRLAPRKPWRRPTAVAVAFARSRARHRGALRRLSRGAAEAGRASRSRRRASCSRRRSRSRRRRRRSRETVGNRLHADRQSHADDRTASARSSRRGSRRARRRDDGTVNGTGVAGAPTVPGASTRRIAASSSISSTIQPSPGSRRTSITKTACSSSATAVRRALGRRLAIRRRVDPRRHSGRRLARASCSCRASSTRTSTIRRPTSSRRTASSSSNGSSATRSRRNACSRIAAHAREVAVVLPDRAPAQRHDDGAGVRDRSSGIRRRDLRGGAASAACGIAAGKVLMDRNCPSFCAIPRESGYAQSAALIERWHGRDRLLLRGHAALRADVDRSPARACRPAARRASGCPPAVARRREPRRGRAGLPSSFRGAGATSTSTITSDCFAGAPSTRTASTSTTQDRKRMAATGAAMSFCATSNLFLGSGLFDLDAARAARSRRRHRDRCRRRHELSMLRTLDESYKVAAARATAGCRRLPRSTWRRSAAHGRWGWTTASATSHPACRPTSSCSILRRRR